jgi:hypothetical protein
MMESKLFFAATLLAAVCFCAGGGSAQDEAGVRVPEPGTDIAQIPALAAAALTQCKEKP